MLKFIFEYANVVELPIDNSFSTGLIGAATAQSSTGNTFRFTALLKF